MPSQIYFNENKMGSKIFDNLMAIFLLDSETYSTVISKVYQKHIKHVKNQPFSCQKQKSELKDIASSLQIQ